MEEKIKELDLVLSDRVTILVDQKCNMLDDLAQTVINQANSLDLLQKTLQELGLLDLSSKQYSA